MSFLIVGIVAGFLVVWLGIYDLIVFINPIPVLLGDEVYRLSIQYFGNPNSPQAHYSIPWFLRIPQVYVSVSFMVWGLIGLLFQFVYNRGKRNKNTRYLRVTHYDTINTRDNRIIK